MRSLTLPALLLFALTPLTANAVTLLTFGTASGDLPTCAESCTALTNANAGCVPPAAPVSNSETYLSCFCQSAYLTGLSTNPDAVCTDVCTSATDLAAIQTYYNNMCSAASYSSAAAADATAASTTAAAAAAATSAVTATADAATGTATTATTTASSTATSTSSSTTVASTANKTWWSAHSRWIAMVIVLIIAFALIIVLGVCLKKRHRRKANRTADLAPPVVWGPHQNQDYTGGVRYMGPQGMAVQQDAGKGKGRVAVDQEMGESSQGGSRRLFKSGN